MKLGAAISFAKPIALNDLLNAIEITIDKIQVRRKKVTSSFQNSPIIAKSS